MRAAPKSPTRSAPRSARSTRRWARARSKSPTRSTAASAASRNCWSAAPRPSPTRSRPAPRPPPTRSMPAWSSSASRSRPTRRKPNARSASSRSPPPTRSAPAPAKPSARYWRQRRSRPQLRRQGRRDRQLGQPAHQRNGRRSCPTRAAACSHAITEKGQQFAGDVTKATEQAIKSIEDKGFAFTRTMMDNSAEITRMINSAGETAANTVTRTLNELHDTAQKAIEQSKDDRDRHRQRDDGDAQYAALRHHRAVRAAARSQHHAAGSALRLAREHERARKHADAARVGIRHRHERGHRARPATPPTRVEANIANFRDITARVVTDLGQLASQFDEPRPRARQAPPS